MRKRQRRNGVKNEKSFEQVSAKICIWFLMHNCARFFTNCPITQKSHKGVLLYSKTADFE